MLVGGQMVTLHGLGAGRPAAGYQRRTGRQEGLEWSHWPTIAATSATEPDQALHSRHQNRALITGTGRPLGHL